MSNERPRRYSSWQERVGEGALTAQDKMQKELFKKGLKAAPKGMRVAVGGIRGAPGAVYDAVKFARSKDKWRDGFGIAGSILGGMGGGALGGAVGGPVAPATTVAGSIIGSSLGEDVGKDFYDENAAFLQKNVEPPVNGAIHWVHKGIDDNLAKVAATKRWIEQRNAALKRR